MRTVIAQAETFQRVITLKYAETGLPVDLTGCTAYCQMRTYPNCELIATATCTVGETSGRVYATFSSAQTEAMPLGQYGFDIWLVNDGVYKPIHTELVEVVGRYTMNMGGE